MGVVSWGAKSCQLPIWVRSTFLFPPRLQFVNFFRHSICFSVFDIMLVTKIRWFLENLFSNFYCNFQIVCSFQFLIWDRLFSCLRYVCLSNSYNTISNVAAKGSHPLKNNTVLWILFTNGGGGSARFHTLIQKFKGSKWHILGQNRMLWCVW